MDYRKYKYFFGTHKQKNIIWINFPNDASLRKALIERFPSARWSATVKSWYLPDMPSIRAILNLSQQKNDTVLRTQISSENFTALKLYREQLSLRAYSQNTERIYLNEFVRLLRILGNHHINMLTPERLKDYFIYVLNERKPQEQTLNTIINAIKFYFEKVQHNSKMFFDIPRPKLPQQLPKSLTNSEIRKLFSVTHNPKHLLALKLAYGMGLRVSEIANLKIEHIDSASMRVLIAGAKGKKDRYVQLPHNLLQPMRDYYRAYKPKVWLFEGQYGHCYSVRSIQMVFKNAMQKASIRKNIGIHGLRHSYATHLLESGTDVRFIQELLGHNSIKTTQVYTQVTDVTIRKIVSPLDLL